MKCKKITAIVRASELGNVERGLKEIGVKGMTAFYVFGFGEFTDMFDPNKLTRHIKIETWAREDEVEKIVNTIIDCCHTGLAGDGMITVLPVECVWRIRTKEKATPDEL